MVRHGTRTNTPRTHRIILRSAPFPIYRTQHFAKLRSENPILFPARHQPPLDCQSAADRNRFGRKPRSPWTWVVPCHVVLCGAASRFAVARPVSARQIRLQRASHQHGYRYMHCLGLTTGSVSSGVGKYMGLVLISIDVLGLFLVWFCYAACAARRVRPPTPRLSYLTLATHRL